jgi:hypothetical protein
MSPSPNPLENLARAKLLAAEPTSAQEIGRLLERAEAQLRDGGNASNSAASRFTLAYGAAYGFALAALRAQGFRPSASQGHRKVVFQVLEATAGAPRELWLALDRYHDRRNAFEYEAAAPMTDAEAADIVALVGKLRRLVLARIRRDRPDLIKR